MPYTPPFPKPLDKSSKRSLWKLFQRGRRSWLATLYEGSYRGKISRIKLPGVYLFLVKFPDIVREVLVTEYASYPKHDIVDTALKPLLGSSIFTTNGPVWERQRRMLDPAFGQAKLKDVFQLMRGGSDALLQRLDSIPDGGTVDIELEMTHVTADIILRTILSDALDAEGAHRIYHAFSEFQEHAVLMIQMRILRLPLWLVPRSQRAWKKTAREVRSLLADTIRHRYEASLRNEPSDRRDILQSLLEIRDPEDGSAFTLEELVDQVAMLFLAGHETSASALSWALFLIAKCPEVQQQLHEETLRVLGTQDPEFQHIARHKMIRNVFKETMRLYPPVGFLTFRKATNGHQLGGMNVPEGSPVAVSPWLVHRNRDLWERPDEFDPSRFEDTRDQPACSFIPFGQGPRICMGAAFATQEAMLILASLTRRYRFEAIPGDEPEPTSRLTIRSLNGIRLRIWKRQLHENPPAQPESPPANAAPARCPFH